MSEPETVLALVIVSCSVLLVVFAAKTIVLARVENFFLPASCGLASILIIFVVVYHFSIIITCVSRNSTTIITYVLKPFAATARIYLPVSTAITPSPLLASVSAYPPFLRPLPSTVGIYSVHAP